MIPGIDVGWVWTSGDAPPPPPAYPQSFVRRIRRFGYMVAVFVAWMFS